MADISVTATSVVKGSGATVVTNYVFGETVTAGMSVYLKSTDSKWYKAQSDGTAEESGYGVLLGVALNGGAVGQAAAVQTAGLITIGATVTVGETYIVSATAGGIAPVGDISTNKVSYLGYASAAGIITLAPNPTGITHA